MEILFGLHPVTEAVRVRPKDLDHITVLSGPTNPRVAALLDLCRSARVRVSYGSREELQRMSRSENHGGAVAFLKERKLLTIEDLIHSGGDAKRFFLALRKRRLAHHSKTDRKCARPPLDFARRHS